MAIIINGQVIDLNNLSVNKEEKVVVKEVVVNKTSTSQKVKKAPVAASKSDVLVIDRKAKSIGKKSRYLLDMLTLDEE